MNTVLLDLLRCTIFVLVPCVVFGTGLWAIVHYVGMEGRLAFVLTAAMVGLTFFATSFVGMAIDPRWAIRGWGHLVLIAALIGVGVFIFALLFTPMYAAIIRMLRR